VVFARANLHKILYGLYPDKIRRGRLYDSASLCPFPDFVSIFICKFSCNNQNAVDYCPYTKTAQGYHMQYTGSDLSHIESMNAQKTHEKTQQKNRQNSLFSHF
jgi:hypothetical protein